MKKTILIGLLLLIIATVVSADVYQENANETACTKTPTNNNTYDCISTFFDGNWSTYDYTGWYPIYINYTKPIGEVGAIWSAKGKFSTEYVLNMSLPDSCWNYNINKIELRIALMKPNIVYQCRSGIDIWTTLGNAARTKYEEGIFWQGEMTKYNFANNLDIYNNPGRAANLAFMTFDNVSVVKFNTTRSMFTIPKTPTRLWINFSSGVNVETRFYSTAITHGYLIYKEGSFLVQMYYDRPQAGIFLANGTWYPLITGPVLNLNTWNKVKFTYDNKNARLYVNGVMYSKLNVNKQIIMNDNPIYIGNKLDFTRNFAGYMDYITLSNKV